MDLKIKEIAADALAEIGTLEVFKKLLQLPKEIFYEGRIFLLARKLAIKHHKAKVPFIPVYPEVVERMRR